MLHNGCLIIGREWSYLWVGFCHQVPSTARASVSEGGGFIWDGVVCFVKTNSTAEGKMECLWCAGNQEPVPGLGQPYLEWAVRQRQRCHCQVSRRPTNIQDHPKQSG